MNSTDEEQGQDDGYDRPAAAATYGRHGVGYRRPLQYQYGRTLEMIAVVVCLRATKIFVKKDDRKIFEENERTYT